MRREGHPWDQSWVCWSLAWSSEPRLCDLGPRQCLLGLSFLIYKPWEEMPVKEIISDTPTCSTPFPSFLPTPTQLFRPEA